jgi:hypothetical protein
MRILPSLRILLPVALLAAAADRPDVKLPPTPEREALHDLCESTHGKEDKAAHQAYEYIMNGSSASWRRRTGSPLAKKYFPCWKRARPPPPGRAHNRG